MNSQTTHLLSLVEMATNKLTVQLQAEQLVFLPQTSKVSVQPLFCQGFYFSKVDNPAKKCGVCVQSRCEKRMSIYLTYNQYVTAFTAELRRSCMFNQELL